MQIELKSRAKSHQDWLTRRVLWWKIYYSHVNFSVSINVNEEVIASSDSWWLEANCYISVTNSTWDDAGKSSGSVGIQIQSTDTRNISDLIGVDDILTQDLAGDSSAIVRLSSQAEKLESWQKDRRGNLLENENWIGTNRSNNQIVSSDDNADKGNESD